MFFLQKILKNRFLYITIFEIGMILVSFCLFCLFYNGSFAIHYTSNITDSLEPKNLVIGILVLPFIDTFLYRWLVYKVFGSFTENRIFLIVISACIYSFIRINYQENIASHFSEGIFLMAAFVFWRGNLSDKFFTSFLIVVINRTVVFLLALVLLSTHI